MEVLWMGLTVFAVICISFLLVMGLVKVLLHISGPNKEPVRSHWVPLQVYSGDDALDHPDLKKLASCRPSCRTEKYLIWKNRILTTEVSWASVEVGGREPIPLPPFLFRPATLSSAAGTKLIATHKAKGMTP